MISQYGPDSWRFSTLIEKKFLNKTIQSFRDIRDFDVNSFDFEQYDDARLVSLFELICMRYFRQG